MIIINMNTKRLKLTVEGHAKREESGGFREICNCAGALAQGLAYTVSKLTEQEGVLQDYKYRDDPGNLMLKVFPEEDAAEDVRRIFDNYGDGFELLAKSHPYSVTFIRDGELIRAEKGEGTK